MDEFPQFTSALRALGNTREQRAQALKTDPKTVDRMFVRLPRSLQFLINQPHLLRALAEDAERHAPPVPLDV